MIHDENTPNAELRRSDRKRTPSKRNEDIQRLLAPKSSPSKTRKLKPDDFSDDQSDSFENEVDELNMRSAVLLRDKNNVAGSDLYGFHTPKKKGDMMKLAEDIPKTPITPKTPSTALKTLSLNSSHTPRIAAIQRQRAVSTPSSTRTKNKQVLQRRSQKAIEETESESSADEHSDFEPEGCSDDSTEDDDDDEKEDADDSSSEDSDGATFNKAHSKSIQKIVPATAKSATITSSQLVTRMSTRTRSKAKSQMDDFIPDSDNYFISASNKKVN